jgi:KDO2-lipid IV(A) lauroyltransferase
LVEEAIRELRSGSGTRAFAKRAAARAVVQALRHHEIVVIPIDQNQSASLGVFVDFFGRPACTTSGLARLTRLTGAPVYPAFLVRQGDSERHRIVVLPRVDWVATGDDDGDIVANTQRYTKVFEDMLRRHPEQWIWFHKRWRTRPPGEAAFY